MKKIAYGERDYAFGQTILTLRSAIGLTQAGLAACLGVSRRAVSEWEAGSSYPKVDHLKHLIALGVKDQAFVSGEEAEAIRALWKAAHQKLLLDEQWLSSLLGQSLSPFPPTAPQLQPIEGDTTGQDEAFPHSSTITQPSSEPRVDWGDALAVPTFYGREQELALLTQWIVHDRCHIVSILGMGGIGKSALAVTTMHRVVGDFDVVIFRSLRDALSCEALLDEWLSVFSPQPLGVLPGDLESRLSLLLKYLRSFRTLLVLDNLETILQEGDSKGQFRPGFEEYKRLLRRVAETEQPSCLLLTSREKPADLRSWEGAHTPVRSLGLSGLDLTTCEQLFAETDLVGTPQELSHLAEVYSGNPLALKIVAETITDLFGGEIGQFLTEEAVVFGTITHLLDEHFVRLSALEQTILHWLAIVREPVTIDELLALLVTPLPRIQVFEAIDGLHRRSLIERGQQQASFTLQSVVLEYMTGVLITETTSEIQQGQLHRLIEHGLLLALAKDYIRQAQKRLLIDPLLTRLQRVYRRREAFEKRLLFLLDELREWDDSAQGYGPSNLITLLGVRRGHLRGLDLSQLALRGAYLQGVEMQDTSLAGSTLRDTVFTERFGLTDAITISSTGQYWAAGSWQGEVRVWCEGGCRLYCVWQAHTDNLFTLAFSPDERTLATGSWDGTLKLWDLQSGAHLWTAWHTSPIFSVVFSPDGRTLASGGNDARIKLWDVFSGQQMQTLESQGGAVAAVAWSPDGHLLAGGCFDGSIRFWQVQENQLTTSVLTLMGHSNWVHALAFSPDGTQLASGSWDGTVKLWDMASGCEFQTLTGQNQRVYDVAWSPDGRIIASSDFDGKIWLWYVAQNRYRMVLHGHTAVVHDIAFTPDSSCLLSGSEDATVRLWHVTSGQCIRIIEGYGASFHDVTWSPDGRWLASAGSDRLVTLWEVTGKTPPRELRGHDWCVRAVAWSPDGRLLASAGWDNAIRVWDPATGTCLQVLQDPDRSDILFNDVAWSLNGCQLVAGAYMQGIHTWDMTTYTHLWSGCQSVVWLTRVVWSPDETRLASCESDSISLWEVPGGTLRERFQRHQSRMLNIAWSPDGHVLASGGCGRSGGEVLIWDTTGEHRDEPICALAGLEDAVFAVAWSLNGKVLISGDRTGRIQWWDVETGACLAMREGHQGAVLALNLAPDGKVLASCGHDSTIQLWDIESGELLRTLRRDRPYERLDITEIRGLTEAQKESLFSLGAITTVTGLGTKMF